MPGKRKEKKHVIEKKEKSMQLNCLAVATVKAVVWHNVTLCLIDVPFIPNYLLTFEIQKKKSGSW